MLSLRGDWDIGSEEAHQLLRASPRSPASAYDYSGGGRRGSNTGFAIVAPDEALSPRSSCPSSPSGSCAGGRGCSQEPRPGGLGLGLGGEACQGGFVAGGLQRLLSPVPGRTGCRPSSLWAPPSRRASGPDSAGGRAPWVFGAGRAASLVLLAAVVGYVAVLACTGRAPTPAGLTGPSSQPRFRPLAGGAQPDALQAKDEQFGTALVPIPGAPQESGTGGDKCLDTVLLNDFTTQEAMESAGWWFNWNDDFIFKPSIYRGFVPQDSYWGFSMRGAAAITLRVTGAGVLTIDFGNLLGTPGSRVAVLLNLEKKAVAEASTLSTTAEIAFEPEDALSIREDPTGIIVINSITFRCVSKEDEKKEKSSLEVKEAEKQWKDQYAALQAEAGVAKKLEREHYAAESSNQRTEELLVRDRDQIAQLEQKNRENAARARLEAQQQRAKNKWLGNQLESLLTDDTEKVRLQAVLAQPTLPKEATEAGQLEQAAVQEAMKEEVLAKEVMAQASQAGQQGMHEQARAAVERARSEEQREQAELLDLRQATKQSESLQRNETWAVHQLQVAAKQEQSLNAQLQEAEDREGMLEAREARAARLVKEAMSQQRKKAVQEKEEREAAATRSEVEAEVKKEEEAQQEAGSPGDPQLLKVAMGAIRIGDQLIFKQTSPFQYPEQFEDYTPVIVIGHDGTDEVRVRLPQGQAYDVAYADLYSPEGLVITTTTAATTTTLRRRPRLYCFALMLPFGYEPELLMTQRQKRVGVFACDETTIFTNSSDILDTGHESPVPVKLVGFSLSVPLGGRWHTALNTDIFNKIWQEVVNEGKYLNNDWVIKADPDTVFFPDRLLQVLELGLPRSLVKRRRQARRLEDLPKSDGCSTCRLTGHEGESCAQHALWLQENMKLTCEDALGQISRDPPLDCGCHCTKWEACDLSDDHEWASDGGLLRGEELPDEPVSAVELAKAPVYINNCRFGLHGPIEVLSSAAVTAYVDRLPECAFLTDEPWGEDKFLDRCMLALGVSRVNVFGMLSETACDEEPAPCGGPDVAFHPFKKTEDYFACWDYANSYGQSPVSTAAAAAGTTQGAAASAGGDFV